jgi:apolipoprotein N-acyltransferase
VVLASNLAVAELMERPFFQRKPDRRTLIAGVVVPLVALGFGFWRMRAVDARSAASPAIKVGMVQGNMKLKDRRNALKSHLEASEELRKQGVDLVVWSEASSNRSFPADGYEAAVKKEITGRMRVPAIVSGVVTERVPDGGPKGRKFRLYNTSFMADEKGNVLGRYDKQFLLMFGEYLPFGETFPILYEWSPNSGAFTPGRIYTPLPFREWQVSVDICYEDISPSFIRKLMREGDPHLLVNMTNDSWFGDTIEPWQHLALAKFRTIEHRRWLVRVTNSGVSAIVDPNGRVVAQTQVRDVEEKQHDADLLVGEVRMMSGGTLYRMLGDIPWWIATAAIVVMAFWRRPDPTRPRPPKPSATS